MRPTRATATVVIDEWRVVAYASRALSEDEVRRVRRRVERSLARAARRSMRRRSPRVDVEVGQ
ncbi:MAG TPA: hypothetical protein VG708_13220 [Mycobacteriales bacterium]|nr:hypothetical protein [Mycobacteriales bacterium]